MGLGVLGRVWGGSLWEPAGVCGKRGMTNSVSYSGEDDRYQLEPGTRGRVDDKCSENCKGRGMAREINEFVCVVMELPRGEIGV